MQHSMPPHDAEKRAILERAGLPSNAVGAWLEHAPDITGDYVSDAASSRIGGGSGWICF